MTLLRDSTALIVFLAALFVRLLYFTIVDQPPVQFDARQYVAVAAAAPLAITHPSLWTDSTARENISLSRVMNDVISRERVVWTPYDAPTYGQAIDWLFFSGPAYPGFLAAVFNLAPIYDFWAVRLAQAILDSLSAVLIWVIMRRLHSNTGAMVAAGLWIVYGPAIMKAGELLTETSSIVLVLALVASLLRAHSAQSGRWLVCSGVLAALLAMAKASAAFLIVPILAAWLLANRKGTLGQFRSGGLLLSSWLIVMLPWILLVHHRFGQLGIRDPSYGTANFRQANILETEGYNTDMAPADFWTYPVWRRIKNRPLDYVRMYLQKLRRLWWRACDDYRIGFPFGVAGVQWFHRFVVLLAIVGLLVWPSRAGPIAWLPIAVIVYFAGLHTLMHVVSRYNLPAMPFVCGAAVTGGFWLSGEGRRGAIRRFGVALVVIAGTIFLIQAARPSFWMSLVAGRAASVWLYWIASVGMIFVAAFFITSRAQNRDKWGIATVSASIIALLFLAFATTREGHAEWAAHVDKPGVALRRTIELPSDIHPGSVRTAYVLIDANISRGSDFLISIDVDHVHLDVPDTSLIDWDSFYGKAHYKSFMRFNGDRTSTIRGWARYGFDGPLLDSLIEDGKVTVTMALQPDPAPTGKLVLYGDLPQERPPLWAGPGLTYSSIERYYEGADPRLWDTLTLATESSRSLRIVQGEEDSVDLSECLGRQAGEYRILLQLLLADERSLYF